MFAGAASVWNLAVNWIVRVVDLGHSRFVAILICCACEGVIFREVASVIVCDLLFCAIVWACVKRGNVGKRIVPSVCGLHRARCGGGGGCGNHVGEATRCA